MFNSISQQKPVVVVGLGLTGVSAVRYCLRKNWPVMVLDSRVHPPVLVEFKREFATVNVICGEFSSAILSNAGLIILSPGIDVKEPAIQVALNNNVSVVGDVELFVREVQTPIIAITGSNGKSTVCDCLGWTFNHLGVNTIVAGNIGTAVLDLLEKEQPELYVLELSSFQIETLYSLSADCVSILNVSPDHLDRHHSLQEYAAVKRRLLTMGKSVVVNLDDPLTWRENETGKTISFGAANCADVQVCRDENGFIVKFQEQVILTEKQTKLKGFHNGLNFAACFAVVLHRLKDLDMLSIQHALQLYPGLEHRCQLVPSNDGIIWINDSKATNIGAAQAAINGFSKTGKHLFLIAGGDAKGADIAGIKLDIENHVTQCWVFGKDAQRFSDILGETICRRVGNLDEAIECVKTIARPLDCVLFSPACASLDMYENYKKRGEHFINLVKDGV